jgi:hypothetical protein
MSSWKIFFTECRRSLKLNLVLFFSLVLLGFTLSSMLIVKKQIEALVRPVNWDADIIILPKGVSLDGLHRSLLTGKAEGLIPLALFETLEKQAASSPLQVLGFIPYAADSKVKIGIEGARSEFPFRDGAIWNAHEITARKDLEIYNTPEWGPRTLGGILARGPKVALESLKNLIDRKTIAQAWYVNSEMSDDAIRAGRLREGLDVLTLLIGLSLAPGLILSALLVRARFRSIFVVLNELGLRKNILINTLVLQGLVFLVTPLVVGILISYWIASVWVGIL